jgi:hypothetical protein
MTTTRELSRDTASRTTGSVDAHATPMSLARRRGTGFWAVAFAFLIVMALRRCRVRSTACTGRATTFRPRR